MSNLHAYLEKHFPASLWSPQGSKPDISEENPSLASPSAGTQFRRKNHTKSSDINFLPTVGEGERWTEDDVRRTFMENFGVSVRIVPDAFSDLDEGVYSAHFLFKYYVILQAKDTWLTDETGVLGDCRGTILQCSPNGWKIAARPFEKFFNQQEIACPVHTPAKFNEHVADYEFVEKADGTMMVLWFRTNSSLAPVAGQWQWSTSTGLIADERWVRAVAPFLYIASASTGIEKNDGWNVVLEDTLDNTRTYVFELCSKETQVITRYATERIYLLGSLDAATGKTSTQVELDEIALRLNCLRPNRISSREAGITSLESALKWVEDQAIPAKNAGKFGDWPEGFVVYHLDRPIAKLKNRAYNDRHAFYANDLLHMRNLMIERYFLGTTDDVLAFCPAPIVAFVDEMPKKVQHLFDLIINEIKRLSPIVKAATKDFKESETAAAIAELIRTDPGVQQYSLPRFFMKFKHLLTAEPLTPESNVKEIFLAWLDMNWKGIMEYWRTSNIPELVEEERVREKERVTKPKKKK